MREDFRKGAKYGAHISEVIGKVLTKGLKFLLSPICGSAVVTAKVAVLLRLVWLWMLIGLSIFTLFVGVKFFIDKFGLTLFLCILIFNCSIVGIILTVRREERRRRHRRRHRNSKGKNRPTNNRKEIKK